MSLFAYLQGALVAVSSIRLRGDGFPGPQMTAAADGTGSMGGIVFDDPTGALTVTGWQSVTVTEPDCTSAPRLFTGYVADRTYRRGPYVTGAGREIDATLVDQNALLSLRLIVNSDGKRPAETDTARIAWLIGSPYLSGLVYDLGLVVGAGRSFDATDYRGQYPADVLNDLCGPRGQIFFAYWDQSASKVGLFFDSPTSSAHTSTLTISNVLSDVNLTTCFPPLIDAELTADPSEVYSRIRYTKKGGSVIRNNLTTASTFFPSPLITRGLQVTNERVGLRATAETFADRILTQRSQEAITVTFTVRLPAAEVGLIDAGHRLGLRFTHLPGFETLAYSRVERKSIVQTEGTPDSYDVTLTCSTYGLTTAIGGGDPGDFPHEDSPPSIVQQKSGTGTLTMDLPITEGNTLVYVAHSRGNLIGVTFDYVGAGYTLSPLGITQDPQFGTHRAAVMYKTAGAAESETLLVTDGNIGGTWYELPGTWTVDTSDENNAMAGIGVTFTAGAITVAANSIAFATASSGTSGGWDAIAPTITHTPGSGWTEDFDAPMTSGGPSSWNGYQFPSAGSLTATTTSSFSGAPGDRPAWTMQIVSFIGDAGDDPPVSGTWVYGEVASMAGAVGTLDFGYAAGSLTIRVDGVLISAASITETNPAAGTFTLAWAPDSDETVRVDYQGL